MVVALPSLRMARVRGVAVSTIFALGIFGCGAQRVEPAPTPSSTVTPKAPAPTVSPSPLTPASPPTPQASASVVQEPIASAPVHVDSVPTDETPPPDAPKVLPSVGIERWRAAIENYVPTVQPGKVVRLNGASQPFAEYLNLVHSRVHQIFANQFLASLDSQPHSVPMNRYDLHVTLEIVVEPRAGRIHRMGVTASSGLTAFDIYTLDSVFRAQPFGPAPRVIVSADGFVYFHWEFHRNEQACGTWNTRPFLLGP